MPSLKDDFELLVISPCRDEIQYLRRSIDSVIGQELRPDRWIIVDDGSTDGTSEVLAEYAAQHSFISVIRRSDTGKRNVGPGVVDAFYEGLNTVDPKSFRHLCKLDLDLDLPTNYFKDLIGASNSDPRLGSCSGKPFNETTKGVKPEVVGDEMSVGMTKFYKTECFLDVGGFVRGVMWDAIDCHRARMKGWKVRAFSDSKLSFVHLRPMGSSQQNILVGRVRHGAGQHFMGTSFIYMLASCAFRLGVQPFLIGSFASLYGYIKAEFLKQDRYGDKDFRAFVRAFQYSCLVRGKQSTIARIESEYSHYWKSSQDS